MAAQTSKPWNDINLPGFSTGKKKEGPAKKFITGVDDSESNKEEPEPEVRLISAEWKPGPKGFQHNEQCFLDVKAEYLKKTIRARIRGRLFGILDGEEIDLAQEVEGFIDTDSSIARMDIKKLWFVHLDHYKVWLKDKNTPSKYTIKGIAHSRGANEIDSPVLDMPAEKMVTVNYIEIPDVHFNHNSAVPCIDTGETLIGVAVAALVYAFNNADKEVVIYGHTDSSGETDFNMHLSELRSKAVKALIDNDQQTFIKVCNEKSNIEDYQTILSVLTSTYGWECDPGSIDNADGPATKTALKAFQSDYNIFFDKSIGEDGAIGQQTWGAFFDVIREMIWLVAKKEVGETNPAIKYGEGTGIHACGEKFAQDANTKKGRKSSKDRRVEIVFKDPADPIEETPYTGPVIMEPIVVKPIQEKPVAVTKIESIQAQCQHTKEGLRIAHYGEKLQIVPDAVGDKVSFKVKATSPEENISWVGSGINKGTTGHTLSHSFSGISNELKNWFFNLITGLPPFLPEAPVKITSVDALSKDKKHIFVEIYPYQKKEYDFDANKYLGKIKQITDKFQDACDFLGQKIKFTYLDGKITGYGQYKEVETTKDVYFSFGIEGGFKPFFGAKAEIKFPLDGLPWIPAPLKRYVAEINAVFELEGNTSLTVSIERSGPKKVEVGGKASGEIVTKLGLSASVWKGKVLDVKLLIVSGITAEGKTFADKDFKDKTEIWKFHAQLSIEWNGLKGEISWNLFDGTWEDDLTITIKQPVPLWKKPFDF